MNKAACAFAGALALTTLPLSATTHFTLSSPDLAPQSHIAVRYTYNAGGCTGQNVAPRLRWTEPPAGTQAFAISLFDPDAPGGGFTHWLLFGIPASARSSDGAAARSAVAAVNGFGSRGYDGPCPPVGDRPHRYIFSVYALDSQALPLNENTSYSQLLTTIRGHVLAQATLTGYYGR